MDSSISDSPMSPIKGLPDCWNDEARMTSLFAPFRDRSLNPQGWDSKLSFWSAMIFKWCESKNRVSYTLEELNKDFVRNGRTPECLPVVLEELYRTKSILQPADFMNMCRSADSWQGWMVDLVFRKPVSWTLDKMKNMVFSTTIGPQTQFIHLAAIKQMCDTIFSSASDEVRGELVEIQALLSSCNFQNVPNFDSMLIAHWLQYQGYAAVADQSITKSESQVLVKLRSTTMKKKSTITEVDLGIYTLSCNQKTLMHYIERLEKEKQDAVNQAKAYLAKGMRSTAKSCLRKKKELEKVIEKRACALDNVQVLLARIRDATSDSQVLESYQVGVAALKHTFKEAGLTEDDVANTMDEVREVLDTQNEIQSLLAEPMDSITEEGLEEELSDLLAQDDTPGPGSGGGLDDSTSDLQNRLDQLRVNDSTPQSAGKMIPTLPATPKTATLEDLPEIPRHIPTPETLTPI